VNSPGFVLPPGGLLIVVVGRGSHALECAPVACGHHPGIGRIGGWVARRGRQLRAGPRSTTSPTETVDLANGQRVRLFQIDTPEVYFGVECYGRRASGETKRLLPPGTRVRLLVEPATDRVDQYGRLLRYVIRGSDGLNVNLRLVADGAAAPYFYAGRRGLFASRIEQLARRARALHRGLWGRCPYTPWDPYHGVSTGKG
jgi:endonuclease YncB( thermonuclease family)